MKRLSVVMLTCLALIFFAGAASADNTARDYIPAPPDTFAAMIYYTHSSADTLYANGHKALTGIDFSGDVGLFRPVYWMNAGPFEIDPQLILPFGGLSLDTHLPGGDLSASGVGDLILLATVWFLNDPQSKTWLGFTPFFICPTGNYENNGALSLGANRWGFREELGFVKGFDVLPDHPAYFEIQVRGDFFTDNGDFGAAHQTLSQDPILGVESHLSYDLTKAFWVSADYYYHWGGESSLAGFEQKDQLANHTIGFTTAFNIAPSYQVLFQYKNDVAVESGLPQQSFTLRFLYLTDLGALGGGKVSK